MKVCNGYISLWNGEDVIDTVFFHTPAIRKSIICKWRNIYGQLNRFYFIISHTQVTPSIEEQALMYALDKYFKSNKQSI